MPVSRITRHKQISERSSERRIREDPCTVTGTVCTRNESAVPSVSSAQAVRRVYLIWFAQGPWYDRQLRSRKQQRAAAGVGIRRGPRRVMAIRSRVHARPWSRSRQGGGGRRGEGPPRFQLDAEQPPAPWQPLVCRQMTNMRRAAETPNYAPDAR